MKFYNIPICEAYNSIILEEVSNKILLQAKKYWNNVSEEEFKPVLDNFLTNIRIKLQAPQNDINFWFKVRFSEFKEFVENYKSNAEKKTEQKYKIETTKDGYGKKIAENEEYELWKVDSYESAKELGRFYKGYSTSWCISTDNPDHWGDYYYGYYDEDPDDENEEIWIENRIYFLIRKEKQNNNLDKIAILINEYNILDFWDLKDNNFFNEGIINNFEYFEPYIIYYETDKNTKEYKQYLLDKQFMDYLMSEYIRLDRIKYYIKRGANIHVSDDTALILAARNGELDIFKYLVENGANFRDNYNRLIYLAENNKHFNIVRYLESIK